MQLRGSQASSLDKLCKLMIIDYTAMVTVVLKECELIIIFFFIVSIECGPVAFDKN